MAVEMLYDIDLAEDGQVVRAIYQSGAEPEFILYPHASAVNWAVWREDRSWIPQFIVAALDKGMPVDQDFMEAQWDYLCQEVGEGGVA